MILSYVYINKYTIHVFISIKLRLYLFSKDSCRVFIICPHQKKAIMEKRNMYVQKAIKELRKCMGTLLDRRCHLQTNRNAAYRYAFSIGIYLFQWAASILLENKGVILFSWSYKLTNDISPFLDIVHTHQHIMCNIPTRKNKNIAFNSV